MTLNKRFLTPFFLSSPFLFCAFHSGVGADRLLSPEKVLKTMAREYFTMLGTLSSTVRGLEILQKYKIFKYLIDLSELQGRDDLCHLIMTSLDYNVYVLFFVVW